MGRRASFTSAAIVTAIATLAAGSLVGCSGAPDTPSDREAAESAPSALLSVTEVTRGEDGAPKVTTRFITRDEQLAMAAARAGRAEPQAVVARDGESVGATTQAWTTDSACSNGNSQWLYDGPGQTGNMLCLLPDATGSQSADLSTYTRNVQSCFGAPYPRCFWMNVGWSGAVRSYWNPGSGAASLFTAAWFQGTDGCRTYFAADGQQHAADTCVAKARYVNAGQEQLRRDPAALNVTGADGSYYVPGSNVTVRWFKDTSTTPVQTHTMTAAADGTFTDGASATCVGWGCGCTSRVEATDASGRVVSTSLPDCLQ